MTVTAILPEAYVIKDVQFSNATGDFAGSVSQVQFDPAITTQTWRGLSPDAVFSDSQVTAWSCTVAFAQDWETAESWSNYLFEHEGDVEQFTFKPIADGTVTFTADLVLVPGAIGGAGGAFLTGTVTLGVQGRPVKTVAP